MHAPRIVLATLALCLAQAGPTPACAAPSQAHERQDDKAATDNSRLSFPTRILPILTKAGCNAGACHGAAIGQGGFKLSLLGYDPQADHDSIVREFSGRRVDLSAPGRSLLLRKATRDLRHKGGRSIDPESDDSRTLLAWIGTAALFGPRDLKVVGIDASPADVLVSAPGGTVKVHVTAALSDG